MCIRPPEIIILLCVISDKIIQRDKLSVRFSCSTTTFPSSFDPPLIDNTGLGHLRASQAPLDIPETNEVGESVCYTDDTEYNAVGPFFKNWDAGLRDIMFPAHVLQDLDEGLLLPSLF